ncbi:hypothetical protein FQN60_016145 [Etheostoma spectabile]|uniref:Uncharacterized protein n=1 Tax=Etheostoma spectabile TaxID=54343 RepID=A0A5J5D2D2_9PERO|nr:hypothetical protein FQN60_016145 [Etheostoma spectabile]
MSLPKRNSDIIVKGHGPESSRGLHDQLSTSTVLCGGTGQQRQDATFYQILPVLFMFQTAVTHSANGYTQHRGIGLVLLKDIQKHPLTLCIQQVRLSICQCSQSGQGGYSFPLPRTLFAVREDDGVGVFLGSQIPLGELKRAMLSEAFHVCRRFLHAGGVFSNAEGIQSLQEEGEKKKRLELLHSLPQSLIRTHLKLLHVFPDHSIKGFLCDPPLRHFASLSPLWKSLCTVLSSQPNLPIVSNERGA